MADQIHVAGNFLVFYHIFQIGMFWANFVNLANQLSKLKLKALKIAKWLHKNENSSTNHSTQKVDGQKINKRGGSNKGMGDGVSLQNKYLWRHDNSIPQSNVQCE